MLHNNSDLCGGGGGAPHVFSNWFEKGLGNCVLPNVYPIPWGSVPVFSPNSSGAIVCPPVHAETQNSEKSVGLLALSRSCCEFGERQNQTVETAYIFKWIEE